MSLKRRSCCWTNATIKWFSKSNGKVSKLRGYSFKSFQSYTSLKLEQVSNALPQSEQGQGFITWRNDVCCSSVSSPAHSEPALSQNSLSWYLEYAKIVIGIYQENVGSPQGCPSFEAKDTLPRDSLPRQPTFHISVLNFLIFLVNSSTLFNKKLMKP